MSDKLLLDEKPRDELAKLLAYQSLKEASGQFASIDGTWIWVMTYHFVKEYYGKADEILSLLAPHNQAKVNKAYADGMREGKRRQSKYSEYLVTEALKQEMEQIRVKEIMVIDCMEDIADVRKAITALVYSL